MLRFYGQIKNIKLKHNQDTFGKSTRGSASDNNKFHFFFF